jgi:hypothetical protein
MKATFRISLFQLLALMLGLIALVVLIPIGVQATTSNVVITDPSNPSEHAHIGDGALLVEGGPVFTVPGSPITGYTHRGAIHAFRKSGDKAWPQALTISGPDGRFLGPLGSYTGYAVASLTVTNESPDPAIVDLVIAGVSPDATRCPASFTAPGPTMTEVSVQPGQTLHTTYPQAMYNFVSSHACLVARISGPTKGLVAVTLEGYNL